MTLTIAQWNVLTAKVIAALATLSMDHDLSYNGNYWTTRVPTLGTLCFHEYYQRWSLGLKDAGRIDGVEGMLGGDFEREVHKLWSTVYWRPSGPAAAEKAREEAVQREREATQQAAQNRLFAALTPDTGCRVCGDTREPEGTWECPGCGTV